VRHILTDEKAICKIYLEERTYTDFLSEFQNNLLIPWNSEILVKMISAKGEPIQKTPFVFSSGFIIENYAYMIVPKVNGITIFDYTNHRLNIKK
jgi:hypothetical protein